jgi:hypothetical protein
MNAQIKKAILKDNGKGKGSGGLFPFKNPEFVTFTISKT